MLQFPFAIASQLGMATDGSFSDLGAASSASAFLPAAFLAAAHQPDYAPSPPPHVSSARLTECKDWLKGRCARGAGCRFHHSGSVSALATAQLAHAFYSQQAAAGSSFGLQSPQQQQAASMQQMMAAAALSPTAAFSSPYAFPSFPGQSSQPSSPYGTAAAYPAFPVAGSSFPAASFPFVQQLAFPASAFASAPHSPYGGTSPSYPGFPHSSYHSPTSLSSSGASSSSASATPPRLASVPELCRDFQHSICFRGSSCRFLHERQICGDWIHNRCSRGEGCKFSHDKRAGPVCRDFAQGRCSRGDECRYWHDEAAVGVGGAVETMAEATAGDCRDWLKGRCVRGSGCRFSHSAVVSPSEPAAVETAGEAEVGKKRSREQPPAASASSDSAESPGSQSVQLSLDPSVTNTVHVVVSRKPEDGMRITLTNGGSREQQSSSREASQPEKAEAAEQHESGDDEEHEAAQQQQAAAKDASSPPLVNGHKKSAGHSSPGTANGHGRSDEGSEDEEEAERQQSRQPQRRGRNGVHLPTGKELRKSRRSRDSESSDSEQQHQQQHQPPHAPVGLKSGIAADSDLIDQTDGAADGDVYLSDNRPVKRRRGEGDAKSRGGEA